MQWKQPVIGMTLTLAVLVNVGSTDERELATRALSESPAIMVLVDGRSREVQYVSELPEGEFQITAVTFAVKKPAFPESIFDNLAKMPHLTEINLSHTSFNDDNMKGLSKCTQVKRLYLSNCWKVTDAGIGHISKMKQLTELRLHAIDVTDEAIDDIVKLPQLSILFLNATDVTDAGLAKLGKISSLTELHLFGTNITDAGLAHISQLKNLKHLDLGFCKSLTTPAVKRLRKQLPQCEIEYSKDVPRLKK